MIPAQVRRICRRCPSRRRFGSRPAVCSASFLLLPPPLSSFATTYAATAPLAAAARASPSAVALVADALAVDLATLVDAGSCGGPVRFMGQKKRAADARSVCGTYIMSVIEIIYEL